MAIVQIHIEKTGGVTLQKLYEDKYGGENIAHYMVRDDLFAPYSIKTANPRKNIVLKFYKFIAAHIPRYRRHLISKRTKKRIKQQINTADLRHKSVVLGHFDINKVKEYLDPNLNQYRSVVRDPLERSWSHYKYWREHKGDVGQRVVPKFKEDMQFEEFALLPEMINYQTSALGKDLSIYEFIGIANKLDEFAIRAGLISTGEITPVLNKLNQRKLPELSPEFLKKFKDLNKDDYDLFSYASRMW